MAGPYLLAGQSGVGVSTDESTEPALYYRGCRCGSSDNSIMTGAEISEAEDGQEREGEGRRNTLDEILCVTGHLCSVWEDAFDLLSRCIIDDG